MKYTVADSKDMHDVARDILAALPRGTSSATILTLSGDLGAGKTTFTQALGKELGVKERITSPTFGIMRSYDIADETFTALIHIDAYRLEGGKDMEMLGWNDMLADPKNLIVIEWPERVKDILPNNTTQLVFEHSNETTRKITVE